MAGFAFDSTDHGNNGAIGCGTVLLADYPGFERAARQRYLPFKAATFLSKSLVASHSHSFGKPQLNGQFPCLAVCSEIEKKIFLKQFENKFNTIPTSSSGRLFDTVASIGVVRQTIIYEAAGAIEFEAFLDDNVIVFTHGKVPPIDGGLALGQAVVASCDR